MIRAAHRWPTNAEARNAAAATDIAFALIGDPGHPPAIAALERALVALRGESAPDPQPAPCADCGDQREVCRLCGPMPRGATCLDHHHDEGIPCPSCSASPGGEAP